MLKQINISTLKQNRRHLKFPICMLCAKVAGQKYFFFVKIDANILFYFIYMIEKHVMCS